LKVSVALEELTLNIGKLNAGKVDVDVSLKTKADKIIIAFRDNGKSLNPLEYLVAEDGKSSHRWNQSAEKSDERDKI